MSRSSLTPDMIRELDALKKADGTVETNDVVAKAKDATSALHQHPAFEWDVNKAAERHWADAARSIIQVWVVLEDRGDGEEREIRATVSLADSDGQRHYYSTPRILRRDRAQIINVVLDRIESAIRSYPLVEFDPILDLVATIRATASRPRRGTRGARRRGGAGTRPSV